jgi:DNA-directed RNA polymerase specialized sigma24 family protein
VKDIDWNEAMHISRWYIAKRLKRFSRVLGWRDIVAETMLKLVKTDARKWEEYAKTTVVCNCTKWTALYLYRKHKMAMRLDGNIAFPQEAVELDLDSNLVASDWRKLIEELKHRVVNDIRMSMGVPPTSPAALRRWEHSNRHSIQRLKRLESGLLERKVIDGLTLEDIGHEFKITKERVRQLEFKFWAAMRNAMVHKYKMPLSQIASLVLVGEYYEDPTESTALIKES